MSISRDEVMQVISDHEMDTKGECTQCGTWIGSKYAERYHQADAIFELLRQAGTERFGTRVTDEGLVDYGEVYDCRDREQAIRHAQRDHCEAVRSYRADTEWEEL